MKTTDIKRIGLILAIVDEVAGMMRDEGFEEIDFQVKADEIRDAIYCMEDDL